MGIIDKNTKYFGLDIAESSLRMVEVGPGQDRPKLKHYGVMPISNGMALESEDAAQEISTKIRELVSQSKSDAKYVAIGLNAKNSFSNLITTPRLAKKELAGAIQLQADQYIPMAYDKVKVDWDVVGETKDGQMEVFIAAAPKTVINKVLKIVQMAKLDILTIEVNAAAMARSLTQQEDVAVMIVNISDTYTELILSKNNKPYLVRSVDIGSETLVRTAMQNLNVDDAQAREFVYKFGMTSSKLEGQVMKALEASVKNIVSEIEKSLKFFQGNNPDAAVEKLILSGAASTIPELPVYLANNANLPVEIANPWSSVSYPASMQDTLTQYATQFPVATGLALRSFK